MPRVVEIPGVGDVEFPDEMSDADVAAAAKKLHAAAQPTAPSPTKWSQKLGEGMVPGFNRVAAAAQAAADPILGRSEEWGPDFSSRYKEHLRANQAQSAETQREAPLRSAVLQTAGAVPTTIAAGAPSGIPAAGLGYGAMYGAGDTTATNPEGQIADTLMGAGVGRVAAHAPRAALAAENVVRSGARLLFPKIRPTPAAQRLLSEGVPLTAGQMQPDSLVGHIEEASSHNPLGMQSERQAALEAGRNVAIGRAAAPGANPPTTGGVQERLRAIYEGFSPAYDAIRGQPIPADALKGLPQKVTSMPGDIDARTRAAVKAEIENALTVLPGYKTPVQGHAHGGRPEPQAPALLDARGRPLPVTPTPPPELQTATAGDLMKVRENIRAESRIARKAQDFDRLRLLGHAEDVITDALEASLPPEQTAKLRATDRQYARFSTLEDAAGHAGPESEFSPRQYSSAVARSSGRRAFTQGRGGTDQQLAQDLAAVFDQRVPPTGMRGVVLSGMPKIAFGPAARFLNLPDIRSGLMPGGTFALPTEAKPNPVLMSLSPEAAARARVLRARMEMTPVAAEDRNDNGPP